MLAAAAVVVAVLVLRPAEPPRVRVLVAADDLAGGQLIESGSVVSRRVPVDAVPPGAVREVEALLGRTVAGPVARGEALTRTRLVPRDVFEGLPEGASAVRVVLADPHSATLLHPGQRALVYRADGGEPVADGVLVLAVDTAASRSSALLSAEVDTGRGEVGVVLALDKSARQRLFEGPNPNEGPRIAVVIGL